MFLHNYRFASATHAILRMVAAFLFMAHGAQKLFGMFGGVPPTGGTVPLGSLPGVAGVLELAGGFLMLIGLFARPVAFILSGEMAVAYFIMHFPHGFWPIQNQGELAALFAFVWLYYAFNGAGKWSVDAARHREDLVVHEEPKQRRRAA
jgi:putative oxidoreductase